MSSLNQVTILGRLGVTPELQSTSGGQNYCRLSIATNEQWTDREGEKQERTDWHSVTVWGKNAENCCKYLEKGRMVLVQGSLAPRTWETEDGEVRKVVDVKAYRVTFVGGGAGNMADSDMPSAPAGDDIPF